MSVADLPYKMHLESKMEPIKSLGVAIFFIALGLQIPVDETLDTLRPSVLQSSLDFNTAILIVDISETIDTSPVELVVLEKDYLEMVLGVMGYVLPKHFGVDLAPLDLARMAAAGGPQHHADAVGVGGARLGARLEKPLHHLEMASARRRQKRRETG